MVVLTMIQVSVLPLTAFTSLWGMNIGVPWKSYLDPADYSDLPDPDSTGLPAIPGEDGTPIPYAWYGIVAVGLLIALGIILLFRYTSKVFK